MMMFYSYVSLPEGNTNTDRARLCSIGIWSACTRVRKVANTARDKWISSCVEKREVGPNLSNTYFRAYNCICQDIDVYTCRCTAIYIYVHVFITCLCSCGRNSHTQEKTTSILWMLNHRFCSKPPVVPPSAPSACWSCRLTPHVDPFIASLSYVKIPCSINMFTMFTPV